MNKITLTLLAALAASVAIPNAVLAGNDGAQTVRPAGYKPIAGDPVLGEKLFNDTKLSTNGMSCASCHANHGAYSNSFAKPYRRRAGHYGKPAVVAENRLAQNFDVEAPNQVWTEFMMSKGKVVSAPIKYFWGG